MQEYGIEENQTLGNYSLKSGARSRHDAIVAIELKQRASLMSETTKKTTVLYQRLRGAQKTRSTYTYLNDWRRFEISQIFKFRAGSNITMNCRFIRHMVTDNLCPF